MRKIIFASVCLLILMLEHAVAQPRSAAIFGVVRDSSENALPKVKVFFKNRNTKEVKRATTSERGEYRIEAPPGPYDLYAELAGYVPYMAPDIRLDENETLKKEFKLSEEERRGQNPLRRIPPQRTTLPEGRP